ERETGLEYCPTPPEKSRARRGLASFLGDSPTATGSLDGAVSHRLAPGYCGRLRAAVATAWQRHSLCSGPAEQGYPARRILTTCRAGRLLARSCWLWRLTQNSGEVPKASARSQAVSGEMPRLPFTISFTRCTGMPRCSARWDWVIPRGRRNSSARISP